MKKYLSLLPLLLICSYVQAQTWQPHPLLTKAQQTAGLTGGEANQWPKVIEYAPSNPNIVYMGVDTSSIWKSTDGGTSWTFKSKGIYSPYIRGIAIKPSDPNVVCVATRPLYGNGVAYSTGIYKTDDGGDNWTYMLHASTGDISGYNMTDVIAWEGTSNAIYCGSQSNGIYKSVDDGDTWHNIIEIGGGTHTFSGLQVVNVNPDPTDQNTIFACIINGTTSTGLHKITHNGSTTVTSRQYLSNSKSGSSIPYKSFKTANGNIYIMRRDGGVQGIYRSTDGGSTFTSINSGISALTTYPLAGFEVSADGLRGAVTQINRYGNTSYWYCNNLTIATPVWSNPSTSDTQNADGWLSGSVVRQTSAVFESSRPTAFHPTNSQIMLSPVQFDVISKSTNGGQTWIYSNTGFMGVTSQVPPNLSDGNAMIWDTVNTSRWIVSGGDYGARLTLDAGVTYTPLYSYLIAVNGRKVSVAGAIEPGGDVCVIAVGNKGSQQLQRTANINTTTPSFSIVQSDLRNYECLWFNGSSTSTIYAGSLKSTDKGLTWSAVPGGHSIDAINPRNNNIVYSAIQSGNTVLVYKSTDSGATWTQPFASCSVTGYGYLGQLTVDPFDENRVYLAVRSKGIYIITTSSAQLVTSGLDQNVNSNYDFISIACDPKTQGVIYTTSFSNYQGINGNGIYKSTDSGATWSNFYGTMSPIDSTGISVNPNNSKVFYRSYAGTYVYDPSQSQQPPSPVGGLPSVSTGTATPVTDTTATLRASINPNSGTTTFRFQYGTVTGDYTLATGSSTISASYGTTSVDVSTSTTGLLSLTNYFTRVQANNGSGSVSGSETTFATTGSRSSYNVIQTGTTTVTVDGILSDWISLPNSIGNTVDGTPLATYSWNTMWKNGAAGGLYVAIQATDSSQYNDAGTATLYLGDGCEIYIDRDNNKGTTYDSYDRHITTGYGSGSSILISAGGTTTGIVVAGSNTAGSTWTKEMFVPWSLFPGGSVPAPNTTIGFDVQGNDRDIGSTTRRGAKGWYGSDNTDYFNTNTFGEVVLIGTTTGGGDVGDTALPLWSHMKLLLRLDDGTGSTSVIDATGNCPPGSITGASWHPGTGGTCLYFDGSDDHINVGTPTALAISGANQEITVAARVKYATTTSAGGIVSKYHSTGKSKQWLVRQANNLTSVELSNNGSTSTGGNGTSTIGITQFKHHMSVYDDVNLKGIVDGIIEYTQALTSGIYNGTASVKVGWGDNAVDRFKGWIDDVRIFNTAISAQMTSEMDIWPIVTNGTASAFTTSSADITATATAMGTTTNAYVQYNTGSNSWGTASSSSEKLIGTDTTPVGFTKTLLTLTGSTTYYYRTVAYNPTGNMIYGTEQTFNTLSTDVAAPIGTVTINSDNAYATSTAATLALSATDAIGVTGYYLSTGSTTPTATQTGWITIASSTSYADSVPYTLSSGDGTKSVFSWYKDSSNNLSNMGSDTAVLDTVYTSISVGTPSASCNLYTDNSKVFGTTGAFVNLAGVTYDENLVNQVKISNNNTSTVSTATGTESWTANNQRVICALDDGLVFYAKLDEDNTTVQMKDSSMNNVLGTNTGSSVGTLTAKYGNCRYFDGTDDSIVYGTVTINSATATVCFWMYPTIATTTTQILLELSPNFNNNKPGFLLDFETGTITAAISGVSGFKREVINSQISYNKFDHYVFVIDNAAIGGGGDVSFYINNVSRTSTVATASKTGTGEYFNSTINLGARNGNQFYAKKVYFDDVRIYNRALSAAEITQLYQLTTPEITNTFSATGYDVPTNQGTDTIYIGNYAIPVTGSATSIGTSTVTLTGSLTANLGNTATAFFEYGTYTETYSGSSSTYVVNAPGTITQKDVSIALTGLDPLTEYFYRLAVTNDLGTTVSYESSFTTDELPNEWSIVTGGQWVYYSQFHKTDFLVFLKSNNRYRSFRKHIRSSKDWLELLANPDSKLSSLPVD